MEQAENIEVFGPELHAWVLRAVFEVFDEALGKQRVDATLEKFGVTREQLSDPEAWLFQEFVEAWFNELINAGGEPELFDRAARLALSPRYLGPLYALVRTLGSTESTYFRVAKTSPRYNKGATYTVEKKGAQHVFVTFQPKDATKREQTRYLCRFRQVQFAAVPTLFDLTPAKVECHSCVVDGDDCCEYEITWEERERRIAHWVAGLVGLGFASALIVGAKLTLWPALLVALGFALGGMAIGRLGGMRSDLADRIKDLSDHHDALAISLRRNESRFEQLLEAKAHVDRKVEDRTAELKKTSDQLASTLDEVRALDRAKTDFFSNVSHELRTPLTLLIGPLDDMVRGAEPPGGTKVAVHSMRRNAVRLRLLINQLLDLSKVDAGKVALQRSSIDPRAFAHRLVDAFRSAAERKNIRLEVEAPDHMAPIALDTNWLESALTNLVANAMRFVDSGGRVVVRVVDQGGDVALCVEDDGEGIPEADLPKIFDRFAQAGSSEARRGGTGIGLALVHEAARLHGGEVTVESKENKGTTFTMTLPRIIVSGDEDATDDGANEPAKQIQIDNYVVPEGTHATESSDREGPSADAPLAVIVEDNPDLRRFLADVLAAQYHVRAASDGHEGLALVNTCDPDVVITDVSMPKMDGIELTRRLRALEHTRTTPILLVTARRDIGQVLEGFEVGANDYLTKPFHGRELLARIDVHVRLQRMVHELAHQERLASLGVVSASVAHNVRNALTALVSGLPAMKKRFGKKLDDMSSEMLDVMIDSAHRIQRTSEDLLDLSRIDRPDESTFHPGAGLMAAVRLMSVKLGDGVEVITHVDEDVTLHGRAGDMNHVFLNLMDNAVKAVVGSGRIRVTGNIAGGEYVVNIEDSGDGIDPTREEAIFQPFQTFRKQGGTGLGLAIARDIVDQHGGTITAGHSDLGGAMFTVRLPRSRKRSTELPQALPSSTQIRH